ncbi:MAG: glutamate racemase [Candidatus Omnitrophica bacterium]|nr:glutamate racemase [Candidatus Omnitrophota bacterium]
MTPKKCSVPVRRTRIGVFDSGIGGLTVYRTLQKKYPFCDFIYYADTAHVPYGGKSGKTIIAYTEKIVSFLLRKKADLIVCACNTASAVALESISRNCPVPVHGVIAAAVEHAAVFSRVAVIGTKLTIKSGVYEKQLKKINKKIRVKSLPAPLFVPLVEEGWSGTDVAEKVAGIYLAPIRRMRPEALIMGCTHYPILRREIADFMGPKTRLVDSSSLAEAISGSVRICTGTGKSSFYVSDDPGHFVKMAKEIMKVSAGRAQLCTEFL